ncbi:hypothetical protein BRC92_00350 [Halobacteriales archaeon QS_4_69_31]|nr:MAG: hypothetical protein BRC92_00350 [Halobacteriales archaeon QS_4_69_31]
MPFSGIDADDTRLSDLSPMGVIGFVVAVAGLGWAGLELARFALSGGSTSLEAAPFILGGFAFLIGAMIAYEDATPEVSATCDNCGSHVRSHSSRDRVDEYVRVFTSGSPRRLELGPLSIVTETQTLERVYCSGECAAADARIMLERDEHEMVPTEPTTGASEA